MKLKTENYLAQSARWPDSGRHILASYDDETIVVYQAYRPAIATWAIEHQRFGGAHFSYQRMSWIKPNFLWMMYRSGWASKKGQESVLAVRIRRSIFDGFLAAAVPSSFHAHRYESREAWKAAAQASTVRLQWDPDHGPRGGKLARRAIQLGLRGPALRAYGEHPVSIEDASSFVRAQAAAMARQDRADPLTPLERVYRPADPAAAAAAGLAHCGAHAMSTLYRGRRRPHQATDGSGE